MQTVELTVKGMKCEGCAETVQSALSGTRGVRRADVSLESSEARITAEDDVEVADLVEAVEEAGYTAR